MRLRGELPRKRRHHDHRPARDRADLLLCAAPRVRDPADQRHDPDGGRRAAEKGDVPHLHGARPQGRAADPGRQAGRCLGPAEICARQCPGLRTAQGYAGLLPHPGRLYRRRGDRAGDLRFLPLARHQPQTALRPDRGDGVHHHPARWRGARRYCRRAGPGRGDPHRRQRRDLLPQPGRVRGILQERRVHRLDQGPRRLGRHR